MGCEMDIKEIGFGDATHVLENGLKLYEDSKGNFFKMYRRFENDLACWIELDYSCKGAKPIEKKMKEYLVRDPQTGKYWGTTDKYERGIVCEIPEGAEIYIELNAVFDKVQE